MLAKCSTCKNIVLDLKTYAEYPALASNVKLAPIWLSLNRRDGMHCLRLAS